MNSSKAVLVLGRGDNGGASAPSVGEVAVASLSRFQERRV